MIRWTAVYALAFLIGAVSYERITAPPVDPAWKAAAHQVCLRSNSQQDDFREMIITQAVASAVKELPLFAKIRFCIQAI